MTVTETQIGTSHLLLRAHRYHSNVENLPVSILPMDSEKSYLESRL